MELLVRIGTFDFAEGTGTQVLGEPIVTNLNVKCHYLYF